MKLDSAIHILITIEIVCKSALLLISGNKFIHFDIRITTFQNTLEKLRQNALICAVYQKACFSMFSVRNR